jgi:uncharacterized protein (TIGR00375 family)
MKFLADLHLHSRYSRATSAAMTQPSMAAWAKIKGLSLIGTTDFTHPEWRRRLRTGMEPAGNGFFQLKRRMRPEDPGLRDFSPAAGEVQFLLSSEMSFVYAKKGKTRKIHLLVLVGRWASAEKMIRRLARKGNLSADGRPVFGMDAADFLRLAADVDPDCLVIPAHIWTPWFSLFGSRSGFDSVEECFEEMSPFIAALETGLSSDPAMSRRVSALDRFALISNSDAHSPIHMGREASAFDTEFSFQGLREALRLNTRDKFLYTVEFFPEEGKYYADGHRKCGFVVPPGPALRRGQVCPVCSKPFAAGVRHRIEDLADRPSPRAGNGGIPSRHLIPLREIIAAACGRGPAGKTVSETYFRFIRAFGDEHSILTGIPVGELRRLPPPRVALGIDRVRRGRVLISPGYDGIYGRVRLFD